VTIAVLSVFFELSQVRDMKCYRDRDRSPVHRRLCVPRTWSILDRHPAVRATYARIPGLLRTRKVVRPARPKQVVQIRGYSQRAPDRHSLTDNGTRATWPCCRHLVHLRTRAHQRDARFPTSRFFGHLNWSTKTSRDSSSVHGFFRRRTSVARGGCSFRTGSAQLRKLLKKASTPRSSPPFGPDAPNAPACSRVA
jgi:hypothetical protein